MPLPQRKSPRLPGYPYTTPGAYFVTVCTHQRLHLFGEILEGAMQLNTLGEIAARGLTNLLTHYPSLSVDCSVVMPNHVHAILMLREDPTHRPNLSAIVGSYKAGVSRTARHEIDHYPTVIWQGRFHDHIIRDEKSLAHIREYIQNNAAKWQVDIFYNAILTDLQ